MVEIGPNAAPPLEVPVCLVFATTIGTMLEQHNVRCGFRQITRAVGLCDE